MGITDRIDAITRIPIEARIATPPVPKSVKIELTGSCNFKCWFCATGKNLREKAGMSMDFYKRVVPEMHAAGVKELGLFYLGESFLCPWLPEAVRFAKQEAGFEYVFLTTNGYLSTPDKMRACMESGLDSLKFSLNWADDEQALDVTKAKGAFTRAVAHIKAAHAIRDDVEARTGYRCGLYASSIKYDGEQQAKMEKAVAEVSPYLDQHYWLPLYNQAGFVTEDEKARGLTSSPGNRGRLDALVSPIPCWALFTEGHISWDGKLTGCCFSHTPDFDFGDLNTMGFTEAWNSLAAQTLRKAHLNGGVKGTPCEHCFR